MFDFLTGKKKKVNLTPDIPYASQEQLFFTSPNASKEGYSLKDFAAKRIKGEGLGFGEDFLDRSTSAPIKSREARFRENELPAINSQLSARGLARSAGPNLATDVLARAEAGKERDINDLISQFYVLNERQKKSDQSEGLRLAESLQGEQRGMLDNMAAASERLVGRNIAERDSRATSQAAAGQNILSSIGGFVGAGGLGNIGTALQNIPVMGNSVSGFLNNANSIFQKPAQVGMNALGKRDGDLLSDPLIREALRRGLNL